MRILLLVGSVLLVAPAARAQDRGQTGITFGPNAVGLIVHAPDRVAIRPEVLLSKTWNDTEDITTWNTGVSALLYVARWDALRTYVAPRILYARTSQSGTPMSVGSFYDFSGAFGAQYSLHRRFGVYGEVGVAFRRSTGTATLSAITTSQPAVYGASTRSGVGAIFYFN
jgi:hypothetical protein